VVFSFDEKTQCQALDRTQPSLPMRPGRGGSMTHDYKRNGTTDVFAALNVGTGEVIYDCKKSHTGKDVLTFFKLIDLHVPKDLDIHVVLDNNLSAHKTPEIKARHEFSVEVHGSQRMIDTSRLREPERRYLDRVTRARVHQHLFRSQVLRAYGDRCAMCRLHHPRLLDAAHIIPDGQPHGQPIVPNGLSLCKIHHAAYDANLIGFRRDLRVAVQPRLLELSASDLLRGDLGETGHERLDVGIVQPEDGALVAVAEWHPSLFDDDLDARRCSPDPERRCPAPSLLVTEHRRWWWIGKLRVSGQLGDSLVSTTVTEACVPDLNPRSGVSALLAGIKGHMQTLRDDLSTRRPLPRSRLQHGRESPFAPRTGLRVTLPTATSSGSAARILLVR
jgi:transposase